MVPSTGRPPTLGKGAVKAIQAAIDLLFNRSKVRVLGPWSVDKRITFNFAPRRDFSLPALYANAATAELNTTPAVEPLESLLKVCEALIEAQRDATKARVLHAVEAAIRDAHYAEEQIDAAAVVRGELRDLWTSVTSDMRRIVDTEAQNVKSVGILDGLLKINASVGVSDPNVFFVVVRDKDLCRECKRLHLLPDEITPRVWKLSEATHGYHKRGEEFPAIGGEHPHCRCTLATLLPGWGFGADGDVHYIDPGHDEYASQRGETKKAERGTISLVKADGEETHVASVAPFKADGSLLMGKRRWSGRYTLPGGAVEPGEKPEDAAHRELGEEAGLKAKNLTYLGNRPATLPNGRRLRIHAFRADVEGEATSSNDPDREVPAWEWFNVKGGVPSHVLSNLHAPKNVTLQLLGLQPDDQPPPATPLRRARRAKVTPPTELPKLVVQHNISVSGLMHAHKIGGLAAPSMAVSHVDHPLLNFGEITLVADHHMIDPKKRVPVYASDVYSPRNPRPEFKVNEKPARALEKELDPYAARTGYRYNLQIDDAIRRHGYAEAFRESQGLESTMKLAYLDSRGHDLQSPAQPVPLTHVFSDQPALRDFFAEHGRDGPREAGDPYHIGLGVATKRAVDQYIDSKPQISELGPDKAEQLRKRLRSAHGERLFDDKGLLALRHVDSLTRDAGNVGKVEVDYHGFRDAIRNKLKEIGEEPQFEAWSRAKLAQLEGPAHLVRRIDRPGRDPTKKLIPYNLESLFREVTRGDIRGTEGFDYGVGRVRSLGTPRFKSVEEIKARQHKLVSRAEMDAHKSALSAGLDDLTAALRPYDRYAAGRDSRASDRLLDVLGEAYQPGKHLARILKEYDFDNVPPELHDRIAQYMRDLIDAPTEYFEAKPQRIVRLNEFRGAAVPTTAPPDVYDVLRHHGVGHIETYDKEQPGARTQAIRRIAEAQKLLRHEDWG